MFTASAGLQISSPATDTTWISPQPGFFKLNVDAAFFSTTRGASLGMLVRDHSGFTHICAATKVGNIDSPLQAKLKAILFGLESESDSIDYNCL